MGFGLIMEAIAWMLLYWLLVVMFVLGFFALIDLVFGTHLLRRVDKLLFEYEEIV